MSNMHFDVVVVGAGPGGYVAAIRAAQLGLRTACIEKSKLGGTCLNVGCIPSKCLLHSSELFHVFQTKGKEHGIQAERLVLQFSQMMARKNHVVAGFNQGVAALFKKNKVTHFSGTAEFTGPHTLSINSESGERQEVSGTSIILATGSEPMSLPFLPFDETRIISSTGALALETVPRRLVVIGAGVIGVELGSVYARLGSEVTFVEFQDTICSILDKEVSTAFHECLVKQGMRFHLSSKVTGAMQRPTHISLDIATGDRTTTLETDVVLIAVGRKPYTEGLGLEKVGIALTSKRQIAINNQFRTSLSHVFAIGDCVDGPMLAHKASEEGIAVAELIAGHTPCIDYMTIPSVVYTAPEVAAVGLTEEEARKAFKTIKTGLFPFKANSRARCTAEDTGFVKLIADAASDRILGVHILGAHASELIATGVIALQTKMTTRAFASAPAAHPTLSEALKEAALSVHNSAIHK